MQKHEHYGHRARVRSRVRKEGLDNFEDHQVLEYALSFVIPYKDTNPIAHKLISKFGSLSKVLEANEEDLREVEGMGEVSAQFLTSLIKIFNFYEKVKSREVVRLESPHQSANFLKRLFKGKILEEMYLVCVAPNNKVLGVEKLGTGNSGEVQVPMRDITDVITRNKIYNVIVAHNHPGGKATPSDSDNKFTKSMLTSLLINGCCLLDHVIIGENDYYSYKEKGVIDDYVMQAKSLLAPTVKQNFATYEVDND